MREKKDKIIFILKIFAIFLIPSLYTIVYLAANDDPYGNMKDVPVAIINNDTGYNIDNKNINIGDEVAKGLVESNGFDFDIIKQKDFSYDNYFMKITIPKSFSSTILNPKNNNYSQAKIKMEVDESKNYIFSSIAGESLYEMQNDINTQIQTEYLSVGASLIQESINFYNQTNNEFSNEIVNFNNNIDDLQNDINTNYQKIESDIHSKSKDIKSIENEIYGFINDTQKEINTFNQNLKQNESKLESYYDQKLKEAEALPAGSDIIVDTLIKIDNNYNSIKNKINKNVSNNLSGINSDLHSLQNNLKTNVNSTLNSIDKELNTFKKQLNDANSTIDQTQKEVLNSKYLYDKLSLQSNLQEVIDFLAQPVIFENTAKNSVKNYGQGLAPYFVSLSLYVGALILLTVITYDDVKKYLSFLSYPLQLCFYLSFSVIQVSILYFLLVYINKFVFIHPAEFIIYSIFVSLSFISIVMFLILTMEEIGEFLAFILLVLQLGGSAGTFPIETAPKFFQIIHPFLPMTYTINKYREILFQQNVSIFSSILIMGIFTTAIFFLLIFIRTIWDKQLEKYATKEKNN